MNVQQIHALMEDVKMALINLYATVLRVMVENDAKLISTNAVQILANTEVSALIY